MALVCDYQAEALVEELRWFCTAAKAPRLRTMSRFMEEEVVIPTGPYEGRKYRFEYQPALRWWFWALDHGEWQTYAATGPSQSGKTLACSVGPLMYHLFELRETYIYGLPNLDMAKDKWDRDIKPIIERTRFREFLPTEGRGSRGGKFVGIQFKNGAFLRFMGGGGDDKQRAHFTSRVLGVTEVDGLDSAGGESDEADKIRQMIARTRAYGARKRIYLECTVTTKKGRIWREYAGGTESRLALPCPRCGEWVTPEREHLVGWRDARDELEAMERGAFCCPVCGEGWSEEERRAANRDCVLVHRGQRVNRRGEVEGDPPRTLTFGFRWSAVNNLFVTAGEVAVEEWRKAHPSEEEDEENMERELCQFIWAAPYDPPEMEMIALTSQGILGRQASLERGQVPDWCEVLTLGIDMGLNYGHWALVAWGDFARCHVVDYGVLEVPGQFMAPEKAFRAGLGAFRDEVLGKGWGSDKAQPEVIVVDTRYYPHEIRAFCRENGRLWLPSVGYGTTQKNIYSAPKSKHGDIRHIGQGYHIIWNRIDRCFVANVDSDHWKGFVHARLSAPVTESAGQGEDEAGGPMTIFHVASAREHQSFAKHLVAEKAVEEFVPGRGTVRKWKQLNANNHWLDAVTLAAVGGYFKGIRLSKPRVKRTPPSPPGQPPALEVTGGELDSYRRH